jgi:copper chaperone CopZ
MKYFPESQMKRDFGEPQAIGIAIFSLYNIGCSSYLATIERKLKRLPGIKSVDVNHVTDTVSVNFNPAKISQDDIRNCMKQATTHEAKTEGS